MGALEVARERVNWVEGVADLRWPSVETSLVEEEVALFAAGVDGTPYRLVAGEAECD